jgi:arylsulfatase A-like enzyme
VTLRLLAAALVVTALAGLGPAAPPNVLLIVIDTLRADHLGSYGYDRPTSPHLDALAASGTRFALARSTSSWTAPAVASILSGRYPVEHAVERFSTPLAAEALTIAEAHRDAGYATAAISANPAYVTPEMGFAQGFDSFEVLHGPPALPTSPDAVPGDANFRRFVEVATADQVTDAALRWINTRKHDQRPFFFYLHYFDPHAGYHPPAEYAARFGASLDAPLATAAQAALLRSFKAPDQHDLRTLIALYDAEIAFTDAEIGRLLAGIDRVERRTLVVVTADHGEEFGDHGGLMHGRTLWEEQLRVPLILNGPRVPNGVTVEQPISLVSLWPTLAALTGVAPPRGGERRAATLADGGGTARDRLMFADLEQPHPVVRPPTHRRAIIDDGWKLLVADDDSRTLFDLANDPGERHDVSAPAAVRARALHARSLARDQSALASRAPARAIELTEERRARLKALGYLH